MVSALATVETDLSRIDGAGSLRAGVIEGWRGWPASPAATRSLRSVSVEPVPDGLVGGFGS